MNTLIKLAAASAFAVAVSACGAQPTASPPPTHTDGGDFLPAYLAMLQGKQPFPHDTCQVHDLHDLLIPCDGQ